jgi:hypothetical protein
MIHRRAFEGGSAQTEAPALGRYPTNERLKRCGARASFRP